MTNSYNQHTDMFKLLTHEGDGVLSTISVDVAGFPFGSATPYCLDANFVPNILISSIAQHTKNIVANNKVSLLISERSSKTNKQARARLTYIGEAVKVEGPEAQEAIQKRYLNYFPSAQNYFKTHDFSFYKIEPVRLRYIGGFGKIYWIEKDSLNVKNLFSSEDEQMIISHMNNDHAKNLIEYARHFCQHDSRPDDVIVMSGLDQFGVDLSINDCKQRIDFVRELSSVSEARAIFVEMARESDG